MRTFLVRHGSYSTGGEKSLTPTGHEQAREAGEWFATQDLGKIAIFSSHTHRSRQTADEIMSVLGIDEVCFNSKLDEDFRDDNVLENIGRELLGELCVGRQQDIETIIAVSHQPTIQRALSNTPRPIGIQEIIPGSIHEFVPYKDAVR